MQQQPKRPRSTSVQAVTAHLVQQTVQCMQGRSNHTVTAPIAMQSILPLQHTPSQALNRSSHYLSAARRAILQHRHRNPEDGRPPYRRKDSVPSPANQAHGIAERNNLFSHAPHAPIASKPTQTKGSGPESLRCVGRSMRHCTPCQK